MIRLVVWFYRTWYQVTDWWNAQTKRDLVDRLNEYEAATLEKKRRAN